MNEKYLKPTNLELFIYNIYNRYKNNFISMRSYGGHATVYIIDECEYDYAKSCISTLESYLGSITNTIINKNYYKRSSLIKYIDLDIDNGPDYKHYEFNIDDEKIDNNLIDFLIPNFMNIFYKKLLKDYEKEIILTIDNGAVRLAEESINTFISIKTTIEDDKKEVSIILNNDLIKLFEENKELFYV